ncbi:MAG: AEC family transporter [Planctomycetota bacterium]|nr:AEC family transporter [Planctomycetota bacterium]
MMLATQNGATNVRFVLLTACIFAAIAGGYVLRRLGVLKPEWAGRTMSGAIIICDAPIACLAIWFLQVHRDVWMVPVAGAIAGVASCLVGLAIARWCRMPPADAAVFGLQGGMGNAGYTLGGVLAFVLWGIQGLALEQMFCMMWPFFAFLFCFPIGRYYAERASSAHEGGGLAAYALKTLGRSLADLRSLPLYTATLGLALNLAGAPPPTAASEWHVIDVLMLLGIFLQFGSVGMTVRASRMVLYWKKALGSAAIKFLVSPLVMLAVTLAIGMAGAADPRPFYICLLLAAMPTALYSVLMANLFGLNRDLANTTFIVTHAICFAVAIPALCFWYAGT